MMGEVEAVVMIYNFPFERVIGYDVIYMKTGLEKSSLHRNNLVCQKRG